MDTSKNTLTTLFRQLGLAADDASMEQFLREGLEDDSDWAEAIDELNALLRH